MKKLTKAQIKMFAPLSDQQLADAWERIGVDPANRVKAGPNKGMIMMKALKKSDLYLAEILRRRRRDEAVAALEAR